jgi:hypothetical protein
LKKKYIDDITLSKNPLSSTDTIIFFIETKSTNMYWFEIFFWLALVAYSALVIVSNEDPVTKKIKPEAVKVLIFVWFVPIITQSVVTLLNMDVEYNFIASTFLFYGIGALYCIS